MGILSIEKEFVSLKVHNQNESMMVGVLNMDEAMVPIANVEQETQPMLNMEMSASQKYIEYQNLKLRGFHCLKHAETHQHHRLQ